MKNRTSLQNAAWKHLTQNKTEVLWSQEFIFKAGWTACESELRRIGIEFCVNKLEKDAAQDVLVSPREWAHWLKQEALDE